MYSFNDVEPSISRQLCWNLLGSGFMRSVQSDRKLINFKSLLSVTTLLEESMGPKDVIH